jgi:BirA family biotin operon repressor/biotin-[acetyl-CoA-carboxylase] ligase
MPPDLDRAHLAAALDAALGPAHARSDAHAGWPKPIVHVAHVIDSTNSAGLGILRAVAHGPASLTVLAADHQVAGRGRIGRSWQAEPGCGLLFTLVFGPLMAEQLAALSGAGALAAADAITAWVPNTPVQLKWPNDVLLDGRKVCGVLPEAAWEGERLLGVVLGIGVNVRGGFAGTDLYDRAVSLEAYTDHPVDRSRLCAAITAGVVSRIFTPEPARVMERTVAEMRGRLAMLGARVSVRQGEQVIVGVAEALDAAGALLVRGDDGALHRATAGDLFVG